MKNKNLKIVGSKYKDKKKKLSSFGLKESDYREHVTWSYWFCS